jgi:leucyl-tRNA synthetase/phosphoserine phosphatase
MRKYDHKAIEKKWQKAWAAKKAHVTKDKVPGKKNEYVLVEFPYPSGNLHVGHWYAFAMPDIYARFRRAQGKNVLYPMGFDAFGLPAENAAIKNGLNPKTWTKKNIAHMKKQLASMGASFDWSREVATIDPEYYKWTQWQFLQFYKNGLAYRKETPANWCPKDKTVLANEQVVDGKCERCGTEVEQRLMLQWNLKITDYADRLIDDLTDLDWPLQIKESQRNWIGRSEGAEIDFGLDIDTNINRFVILHGRKSIPADNFYPWLKEQLEQKGYAVEMPTMPGTETATDAELTDYVQAHCSFDEQTAIVAHSFGGVVALRLLERGVRVGRVILVATPFSGIMLDGKKRPNVTAAVGKGFDFDTIKQNARGFVVLSDAKDFIVPITDAESFADKLDCVHVRGTAVIGHFNNDREPDVLMASAPTVRVFTTRPDTLLGATYLVLAPEHPLVIACCASQTCTNKTDIEEYVKQTKKKTELERQESKEKTGIELKGVVAVNPASGERIPVYIADYVLAGYGTGAIMAVPAHDERDFEFAKKIGLKVRPVIQPMLAADTQTELEEKRARIMAGEECYLLNGDLMHSGEYDGMNWIDAKKAITEKFGRAKKTYRLRDWGVSRQRYWGVPIPIIHCDKCGAVPVPDKDLPVKLPDVKDYLPSGEGKSPLAKVEKWVNVECPSCAEQAKKPKYLIFDFDGVLGDTREENIAARIAMGDAKDYAESEAMMLGYFSERPWHHRGNDITDEHNAHHDDWTYRYAVEVMKMKKFKMFDRFVREIKKIPSAKTAIVSAGHEMYSKHRVKEAGIKYTHFLAGNHDSSKENKIERIAKAWGVDVKDIYYFTDSLADVYELEGILDRKKIIGCAWGYLGEEKLKEGLPDNQILKNFKDIHVLWKPHMARRETDTLDTFVDSSWYFLRYTDPKNKKAFADKKKQANWMPVDLYSGGAEHTTMHLLYSRFWHKALYDLKLVGEKEPYTRRMNRGLILGPDGQKMSKSKGNVIDPDTVVANLGGDTVRLYLAFIGPYNEPGSYPWNPDSIMGVRRFLERTWRLLDKVAATKKADTDVERELHKTIKKVGEDCAELKFNTAIAQMMIFLNAAESKGITAKQYAQFVRILAPFAPHITEELWALLKQKGSVHAAPWPKFDPKKLVADTVTIAVQINGKTRAEAKVPQGASKEDQEAAARAAVADRLAGQEVRRAIVVPGRLVNFVVG